ncbi:cytidylyltransferase domain-containing protein [Zobellia uliginosa]|uniref:acylneuraminate cytidylyltransferase family protein n=1 Tax=Zobellia uliginosa TaxID=143224 RepID=UPI001C07A14C|nr:acylneuraminate cytidylyltransferase family protein [Zobellia uliginosa]MBU2948252.1 acylneuraminate cytidylyltransferase family protein [Zobellia uliginosa]
MKPMVVIPARGGSKGIPGKNIKKLGGKPLIEYTIKAAREVFQDNEIIVSTDDPKIITVVNTIGLNVPFIRPSNLASDSAGTYEVLLHALEHVESTGYNPDVLILLQPTSPFRSSQHIKEAMKLYETSSELEMVVSVSESKANPYFVLFEENEQGYLQNSKKGSFSRRQDCPQVWEFNGAIYIMNVRALKSKRLSEFTKRAKYVMDEISSHDLDTPLDWLVAKAIIEEKHEKATKN